MADMSRIAPEPNSSAKAEECDKARNLIHGGAVAYEKFGTAFMHQSESLTL